MKPARGTMSLFLRGLPGRAQRHFDTIRSKTMLAFVAMSVITGCFGLHAVSGVRDAGSQVAEIFDKSLMSINYARAAAADFAVMQAVFERGRNSADPAMRQRLAARGADLASSLLEDLGIAADRAQSPPAGAAAQQAMRAVAAWQEAAAGAAPAALDAAAAAVEAQIDLLINFTAGDGFAYRQSAIARIGLETRLNIAGTIAALLISALITSLLLRRIMGPVAAASAAAARIARGELSAAIPLGSDDELGALLGAMAVMRDNIRTMMENEIAQRRSAQTRLLDALESSSEGVLLIDSEGLLVLANTQLANFFPPVGTMLRPGVPFRGVISAAIRRGCFAPTAEARRKLGRWLATRPPFAGGASAIEQKLAGGRWLRVSRSATREGGMVLICSDVTAAKQHEVALEKTNLWFSTALDTMSQGLVLFDRDDRLQVVNRRFADIFGLDLERLEPGISHHEVIALNGAAAGRGMIETLADGRQLAVSHEPMKDGGWVATYEDITARRRAEAQVAFMEQHDMLTGLANRVQLNRSIAVAFADPDRRRRFAVFCLDLDQFKVVNDALGHGLGDQLLCEVAVRLQACVGSRDVVARLGGDEFSVLLLSLTAPNDVVVMAQRILAALRAPYEFAGETIICGTSIGIAMAPGDGQDAEELLRNADTALYRAKADGRGLYRFFEPEMDARQQARRILENDLRRALDNEGFQLAFQPLVEVKNERICGFESLLRWQHPVRGMVSPAEFVPMAEESGLIVPIGEWVLMEACREAATWPDHVKVAVNVSPLQFKSPRLVDAVVEALTVSGLPARRLELEITESVLLHDSDGVLATLQQLHGLGLRISMDDFGTGYSSLSYLRSFPFDKIKIDQSFIRDLGTKADSRAIVRAIIGMGLSLGMRITAEGVENEAVLAILRQEGCTEIQGYYYSSPQPGPNIPELLARWSGPAEMLALAV